MSPFTDLLADQNSPISRKSRPLPAATIDRDRPPVNKKIRGLSQPTAGCALVLPDVAFIRRGLSSVSKKHGKLRG